MHQNQKSLTIKKNLTKKSQSKKVGLSILIALLHIKG